MPATKAFWSALAVLLVSNCVVLPGRPAPMDNNASRYELYLNIPVVVQKRRDWCGPAALSSLLLLHAQKAKQLDGSSNRSRSSLEPSDSSPANHTPDQNVLDDLTQDSIALEVYSETLSGSLITDLQNAALGRGFPATLQSGGSIEDLKRSLEAGYPPLVLATFKAVKDFRHYYVLIGFDEEGFLVRTQLEENPQRHIDYDQFNRMWQRNGGFYLIVYPRSEWNLRKPVDAKNRAALLSNRGVALEERGIELLQSNPPKATEYLEKAGEMYRQAIEVRPSTVYYMNLANVEIRMGRWGSAEQSLKAGLKRDPDHADSWNNLAHVLWKQNRFQEAVNAIDRAISLRDKPLYHQTRKKILDSFPDPRQSDNQ